MVQIHSYLTHYQIGQTIQLAKHHRSVTNIKVMVTALMKMIKKMLKKYWSNPKLFPMVVICHLLNKNHRV